MTFLRYSIVVITLGMGPFALAQMIGTTQSGGESPSEVKPAALAPSVLQGDVDLFTGTYSASYPLGTVSTPGGLSFSLALQYNPAITGGSTPTMQDGIPYGQGWGLNVPTITVSNAYVHHLTPLERQGISTNPSGSNVTFDEDDEGRPVDEMNDGYGVWYAPILSIPGIASGRMVFKCFGNDGAVFVLNTFDRYIEARFDGSQWTVFLQDGKVYTFGATVRAVQMASNTRWLNYEELDDLCNDEGDQATTKRKIMNAILPREHTLVWSCARIEDPLHAPLQSIVFDFDPYGVHTMNPEMGQNPFDEFLELAMRASGNEDITLENPLNGFAVLKTCQEMILKKVTATGFNTDQEVLVLDHQVTNPGPGSYMVDDDEANPPLDDLYRGQVVQRWGVDPMIPGQTVAPFDTWRRYLHYAHPDFDRPPTPVDFQVDRFNPYVGAVNGDLGYYSVPVELPATSIEFDNGFLESPAFAAGEIYPGDMWEVRTTLLDGSSDANFDINIVTGTGSDPGTGAVQKSVYNKGRSTTLFSTFDRMIKWNTYGTDVNRRTSNVFVMPYVPSQGNNGIRIQVGPANSDTDYGMGAGFDLEDLKVIVNGTTEPSAYMSYYHAKWAVLGTGDNNGVHDRGLMSHDPIPSNFGIGLPWSSLLRVHAKFGSNDYLPDHPATAAGMHRWWSHGPPSMPWTNTPTFVNDATLSRVELIRYGKQPYMLHTVSKLVRQGTQSADDPLGMTLVQKLQLTYEAKDQAVPKRSIQPSAGGSPVESYTRRIYELVAIEQAVVHPSTDGEVAGPIGLVAPVTRFRYMNANDIATADPVVLVCSPTTQIELPREREQIISTGRLLQTIIDPLGQVTTVEYNDPYDPVLSSLALHAGDHPGLVLSLDINSTPSNACDDRITVVPGTASITPTVAALHRSDANGEQARTWNYTYTNKRAKHSTIDLGNACYGHTRHGTYNYGFKNVTVLGPDLGGSTRVKRTYEFFVSADNASYTSSTPSTSPSNWPAAGVPIGTLALDWPPADIGSADYRLWGRMKKQSVLDPQGQLLETTETDYSVVLAYLNGVLRPGGGAQLQSPHAYAYMDMHPAFVADQDQMNGLDVFEQQGAYLGPEFLEFKPPASSKYAVEFPEQYLNSYFIRKEKEMHTVYDPNGCAIPATSGLGPQDPSTTSNPHATGYVNTATTADAGTLITALANNGLTEALRDQLIGLSPLKETVLEQVIAVADAPTAKRALLVLQAQPQLSDACLLQVLGKESTLGTWLVEAIALQQPWHTDALLAPLLLNTAIGSAVKTDLLLKQERLSTTVQSSLLNVDTLLLAPMEVERVLRAQPPLTMAVCKELVENTAMPAMNTAAILVAQPWLSAAVLAAIKNDLATWPIDAVEEVLVHGKGQPADDLYIALLQHTPAHPSEVLYNILAASPTPFSSGLRTVIEGSIALYPEQRTPLLNTPPSPLLQYCGNGCTTTELKMRTVTEYEYYEADPAGTTTSAAFRNLLGLENATQTPTIRLKWDPSWLPYRVRTSSPEYPGAHTEHEYFYLQDLRNRYDRHWETIISGNEENFTWTEDEIDGYPAADNFGIAVPRTFYNNAAGPYNYSNNSEDVCANGQTVNGEYKPPILEILSKMTEWGYRTDKVYQHRVTSKENRDATPLERSEFFHYSTRWRWEDLDTYLVIEEDEPCTPGQGVWVDADVEGRNFWSPFTPVPQLTAANFKFHLADVPAGHSLVRSPGGKHGYIESALLDKGTKYTVLHTQEGIPPKDGAPKMAPFASLLKKAVLLRDVYTQADETVLEHYTDERIFTEARPLMSFEQMPPVSEEECGEWLPLLPYECLHNQRTHERNWFCQTALIENERGLFTRIEYTDPILHQYTESMVPCSMYVLTEWNNPGLPKSMTVGQGLPNAQTTHFAYAMDLSLANLTDPNGIIYRYDYDGLGRLWQTHRNGQLLDINRYHQWDNPTASTWGSGAQFARTQQNWTERYMRRERTGNAGLRTRSFVDPNGRGAGTLLAPMADILDASETIDNLHVSGLQTFDSWDRALRTYKPDYRPNGTGANAFALTSTLANTTALSFAENDYEADHRSRPLFTGAPGEPITLPNNSANPHVRKTRYRFLNHIALACDLNLSALEAGMLMPGNAANYVWARTEAEDEDGNLARSYTNALGQQVATASLVQGITKAITLFFYDDQGALTRVINPQKQHSTYEQNILGWTYRKRTVDGGVTKYMYDVSGNVVLEQDANGALGEADPPIQVGGQPLQRPWYRHWVYDAFNRPTRQVRLRAKHPATLGYGPGSILSYPVDPLGFADHPTDFQNTTTLANCYPTAVATPTLCYHHRLTSASTLDWLARWTVLRSSTSSAGGIDLFQAAATDLLTDALLEKTWNYDWEDLNTAPQLDPASVRSSTLGLLESRVVGPGRLSHTTSYPHRAYAYFETTNANGILTWRAEEHFPILYDFRSYDPEGNVLWQLQQFNAKGIAPSAEGRELRLDYPDYDLLGTLRTVNVDVHNDGQLDMQQHHTYDAWGRLQRAYLNVNDVRSNGNQIAAYEYDLARGLLQKTTYVAADCGIPEQVQTVDAIQYSYDVRDRLTTINGLRYDEALYYDAALPAHPLGGTLVGDPHYNGSINGLQHAYNLTGMVGYNGVSFENPTRYAFQYDGLGRMTAADAVQGDAVLGASAATDPTYRVGDERYTFDRIGNMRNVQRHGTFTATPAGVEQVQWYYGYGFGTSCLTQVLAFATSALPTRSYQYDRAGNTTKDNYRGHRTAYGRSHLPMSAALSATARVAGYHYDAADQRVYKSLAEESGTNEPGTLLTETFYLRDAAGRELGVLEGTGEDESGTWTWYAFGGQRFAQVTPTQQPDPNADQSGGSPFDYVNPYSSNNLKDVGYYVHDHLGNTRVLYTVGCNGEGNTRSFVLENAVDYYPYGSVLREYLNERAARYLTTMHERDAETALDYRGARYYDSDVARFLSLDPAQAEYPGWSSYNYVLGNPVSLVDPTGRSATEYKTKDGRTLLDTDDGRDIIVTVPDRMVKPMEYFAANNPQELLDSPEWNSTMTATNLKMGGSWDRTTGQKFQDALGVALNMWTDPQMVIGGLSAGVGGLAALGNTARSLRALPAAENGAAQGTRLFRVWGDEAGANGRSWTTTDPRGITDYRNAAGLPDQNTGRFLSEGILGNTQGVRTKSADPLHGNAGGLPEVVVPDPANQIQLQNVQGLNPPF